MRRSQPTYICNFDATLTDCHIYQANSRAYRHTFRADISHFRDTLSNTTLGSQHNV